MNKIGSVKVVDGFTFTLVEKEKFVYMVEITKEDDTEFSELRTVGHNTWKSGKFTKILRELNPQPKKVKEKKERTPREPQPKVIEDVTFRIVERNKETKRVKVVAEGFDGIHEMSLSTWYRGRFYKNAMKHLRRLIDRIEETKQTFALIPIGKVLTLEDILCYQQRKKIKDAIKKVESDTIDDVLRKLHKFENNKEKFKKYLIDIFMRDSFVGEQELKRTYKRIAHEFHPDVYKCENSHELMKIINEYFHGFMFV